MAASPDRDGRDGIIVGAAARPIYPFDRAAEEHRLSAQSRLFDPFTERLFRAAGLAAGMRVLDLGSGVGDTTMLVARIVGPRGAVLGVDLSAERISAARRRAAEAGLRNIEFRQADATELDLAGRRFDALVGRLVLMYLPDPVAVLRSAAHWVRPGGLVCFQELDATSDPCYPLSRLWRELRDCFLETLTRAGVQPRMGLRLFSTFVSAGLPEPDLRLEAAVGGGARAPVFAWADVFTAAVPLMERFGTATAADLGPTTLAQRLLADVTASRGVVVAPPLIGAWARRPGGNAPRRALDGPGTGPTGMPITSSDRRDP